MRLGRFYVTSEFYHSDKIMIAMQRDMAILNVRIAYDAANTICEFTATGEMFDDIPDYNIIPQYKVQITSDIEMEFKFVRIGDL